MRDHYYSPKHRKPTKNARRAFCPEPPMSACLRQVNRVSDSVLKGLLWHGYGVALVSWFFAVNVVILFSQLLKCK